VRVQVEEQDKNNIRITMMMMMMMMNGQQQWKNKTGRFWVYGQELTIYSPDYPQKYCCGCSIV